MGEVSRDAQRWDRRWSLVAAAAIVVLALGPLALVAGRDLDSVQTGAIAPTPAPSTAATAASTPSLLADSSHTTLEASTVSSSETPTSFVQALTATTQRPAAVSTASDVEGSAGVVETPRFEDVRGWIAFRSGDDLVAVDPANPATRLSFGSSGGADPIGWSADGTRLLLRAQPELVPQFFDGGWWIGTSTTTSPLDFYVLNSDGSRTRLTRSGNGATWGSFSPDGTNVVFACCGSEPGPYIVDAEGHQSRLLGDFRPSAEPLPEWAAWSPDGSRIAFVDFSEDHPTYGRHASTLSFLDPDTGETLGDVINVAAAGLTWSPDGSQLAFWTVVLDENADPTNATLGPGGDFPAQIFVINADGSELRQLTHDGDNRWPTWSPDGSRIAFAQGQLTLQTAPDGSQAAFVQPGTRQLIAMASDGTDVQRVEGVSPEGAIAWNPAA